MKALLKTWVGRLLMAKSARKTWNDGVPIVTMETAKHVSQHYAQHWTHWTDSLLTFRLDKHLRATNKLGAVVHKDFWTAAFQNQGHSTNYWHTLMGAACMEGNLSIVEAFAEVLGTPQALQKIEAFAFVHPRVVAWQAAHGMVSKKHVRDLINVEQLAPNYSGWDAQEFVLGGPAMLAWVLDWVKLPNTVIDAEDGHALVRYLQSLLDVMQAEPGARASDGMPSLRAGHQYRKHHEWSRVSHMATPIMAEPVLVMVRAVYQRFNFEPKLMDTVLGRWCVGDMDDARVCAIVQYMDSKVGVLEGMSWSTYLDVDNTEGGILKSIVESRAKGEGMLLSMLEWQAQRTNSFSVYQAALPFFRVGLAQRAMDEQLEVGSLVAD